MSHAQHVRILGYLYLVFGIIGVCGALTFFLFLGGIGSLSSDPEAAVALPIVGTALGLFFGLLALPSLLAGWGLLKFRNWARVLTIVLSALNILNVPLGTILGAYGLWVLLSDDASTLFD